MSTMHTAITAQSTRPLTVTPPRLLPDGKTMGAIVVTGRAWTLALTPDEARRLARDLLDAASDPKETP